MGTDEVLLVRLVQLGDQAYGVVEQREHVREGVAEEPRDPDRDIDPRPPQLGQRDRLEPGHPAGGGSQTGATPSRASTSPMSSPLVRIADVPQTDSPTDCG